MMEKLLWDSNGVLRSGWRASIFFFFFVLSATMLGILSTSVLVASGISSSSAPRIFFLVNGLTSLIPAIAIGWICGKYLEKLPFETLGISLKGPWIWNLTVGSIVGMATISLAVFVAAIVGGLKFEVSQSNASDLAIGIAGSLVVLAIGAAFEEVLFRGYLLQTFMRSGLAWLAIAMTSVFFGLVHAGNPNATAFSVLNTTLAGIWFSVAYLRTRELWFVTGLHLMWNWTQGSIFGIEISGLRSITPISVLTEIDAGPKWLTGEDYGVEGGIACTIAIVLSTAALWLLPKSEENTMM